MKTDTDKTQQSPLDGARTIQEIPLNLIVRSAFQVRDEYEADIESLAADMAANGLVQPVTVRPSHDSVGRPIYETVAGHRRIEAARSLDWEIIPAIVVDVDDDAAERMLVAENFARRDLTPIEMADTAAGLVKRHGAAEAGRICGKSERWAQRMAYIAGRLSEDWRTVAKKWTLSQASLQAICRGTEALQKKMLDDLFEDYKVKDLGEFLGLHGKREICELDGGGDPDSLFPDTDGNPIASIPWLVCGCGDCDGCQNRSDVVPSDFFDDDYDRNPECLDDKCYAAKMKEWLAGRGLREWSRKLGREVRKQPKGVDSWVGAVDERPDFPIPVLISDSYPRGGIKWFSEAALDPKKQSKPGRWPSAKELRDTAYCETVMNRLKEWKPAPADKDRLWVAVFGYGPIAGKSEYGAGKRIDLARSLSASDAESMAMGAVMSNFRQRGLFISQGQNRPIQAQMELSAALEGMMAKSADEKAALRAEANALAEQRIADVEAAKKAEKAGKRRAKR